MGPEGPQGPAGEFVTPDRTYAIFGAGPQTHFEAANWILESLGPNQLQLRRTTTGGYLVFGITHPNACGATISSVQQVHRFATVAGQTLTSTFCGEGSFSLVNVYDEDNQQVTQFRCLRLAANSNVCQRVY
jgi:hypothetical protein